MKTAAWLLATELGLRVFMRHEQIRQLVTAQPFRPITIFLPEGRSVEVFSSRFLRCCRPMSEHWSFPIGMA